MGKVVPKHLKDELDPIYSNTTLHQQEALTEVVLVAGEPPSPFLHPSLTLNKATNPIHGVFTINDLELEKHNACQVLHLE